MTDDEIIIWRSLVFKHMLCIFLFEGLSIRISKHLERTKKSDLTHMMSMVVLVTTGAEILRIDRVALERESLKQFI